MRAFHFQYPTSVQVRDPRRVQARAAADVHAPPFDGSRPLLPVVLVLLLLVPFPLQAQWPGEVQGRVVDLLSGVPVQGATVEVEGASRIATDGAGEFRIRGLEPGVHRLTASSLGYRTTSRAVEVENGRVSRVVLELPPMALPVEGVEVGAGAGRPVAGGGRKIGRMEIEASAARTVAELLGEVPGLTVRPRGPGGRATVSIRGSGADAVLVLVDGAPLNDPVTGEADLSTLSASSVEEVVVLPGARSARYGPRAEGGVVLVETRSPDLGLEAAATAGSLGRRGTEATLGARIGGASVGLTGDLSSLQGAFSFRRPEEVGGGQDRRRNADVLQASLGARLHADLGGGDARLRLRYEAMDRGLPGKSFAPSDSARQETDRARISASWDHSREDRSHETTLFWTVQETLNRDPDPPFGLPFHDRTRVSHGGARVETRRALSLGPLPGEGALGVEIERQGVKSEALSEGAPSSRTDLGAWLSSTARWPGGAGDPEVTLTGRAHREGLGEAWTATHDLTISLNPGPLSLHLAHRSAFSPPTFGDQFFREGVAVAPNPELRPERVPAEVELGASVAGGGGAGWISGGGSLFRGDVKDMIVWAPDFRFVWSPRNVDVDRSGGELWLEARHPDSGLRLKGEYTYARVVYDRPDPEPVQVAYRPRHTGSFRARWEGRAWGATLGGRYLGTRYPVPARVNALAPFWTLDLGLRGRLALEGWVVEPSLRVDRLLDRADSFIFAFPEPGRTVVFQIRIQQREGNR